MQSTWVFKGRIKRADFDYELRRTVIVDCGPARDYWLLFAHGRK